MYFLLRLGCRAVIRWRVEVLFCILHEHLAMESAKVFDALFDAHHVVFEVFDTCVVDRVLAVYAFAQVEDFDAEGGSVADEEAGSCDIVFELRVTSVHSGMGVKG